MTVRKQILRLRLMILPFIIFSWRYPPSYNMVANVVFINLC